MLFSLLIANYNNGKFFKDCYESIIAQNYAEWEAIVVDDGSTDDSGAIIQNIVTNDKRFKFYSNDKNYGCGYTKRKCVELASGEVCGFIDPDDALLPEALQKMYEAYQGHPNAVLAHSSLIYCNEVLERKADYLYAAAVEERDPCFLNLDHSVSAFAIFKRSAYLTTEGIDAYLQRAVDQDLYLKMYETGPFCFINEPLYLYRRHSNNISGNHNMEKGQYWHWFVIMQAAKRRGINAEDIFARFFVNRKKYERLERKINKNKLAQVYHFFSDLLRTSNARIADNA